MYNFNRMYRSRLQSLEEKRDTRNATLIFIATIGLVIGLGWFTFKGLPKLVVYLSNAQSKTVDKNDLIPPPPPTFSVAYSATNSATIDIPGLAEPDSMIYLTQNGDSAGKLKASADGTFVFLGIALKSGSNSFQSIASDASENQSKPSSTINITFSDKMPEINIDYPTDNLKISTKRLEIRGATDQENRLTINDRWVMVDSQGKFLTTINLNPGENTLVFVVTDRATNILRKELKVTLE